MQFKIKKTSNRDFSEEAEINSIKGLEAFWRKHGEHDLIINFAGSIVDRCLHEIPIIPTIEIYDDYRE